MFHLDNTSGVPEMPEVKDPQSNTPRWFGESESQGGISWPGADWFNIVQAELLEIVKLSGEDPDKFKTNQLATAILNQLQVLQGKFQAKTGYSLIGVEDTTLDKLIRVNVRMFGAHSVTEPGFESFDSSFAFQAAADYVNNLGGGVVFAPAGRWRLAKYTQPVTLPGDDGTAAPEFIATGHDQDIAPEPTNTMYAALRLYDNVKLVGEGKQVTTIFGDWDINSGAISISAGIGIYCGASSKAGLITYAIEGLSIRNFLIGRYVDGIAENSQENDISIVNCGISGVIQGQERCITGEIVISGCYAGDVIGGHWLQRNNTQKRTNIPPYPASDVQLLGWADASPTNIYVASQHNVPWGARHNAIDTFFDDYFFKSRNSALTANGGRLSNTSDNTGLIPAYYGIAGRARTILSRYGRWINNMDIFNLKLFKQHRTPIYVSTTSGRNPIRQAYIEGIGLVDPSQAAAAGNYFGIDVVDPLQPARVGVGYMVGEGGVSLDLFTTASNNQHAPLVSVNKVQYGKSTQLTYVPGLTSTTELSRTTVWDGTNTDIRYLQQADYAFSQPIAFTLGGEKFQYGVGYFTPKLLIGGNEIAMSTARGYYIRNGKSLTANVRFISSGSVTPGAGQVVISGLPFVIPEGLTSIHLGQITAFSLLPTGIVASLVFNEGTTTITVAKDTRGSLLTGSELSTGVLYFNISFTMSISG